jgi:uncharacterized protein (DUF1697 family)
MTRASAFLRAINVGGHTVRMADLRRFFEELGLSRVETFIASGNVVFDSRARNLRGLETSIARKLRAELGYEVATFVRTLDEVSAVAERHPFDAESVATWPTFCVAFLAEPPDRRTIARLTDLEAGVHRFHVHGPDVYWLSRLRQSDPQFAKVALERVLGQPATLRGINTIRRMAARYSAAPAGAV